MSESITGGRMADSKMDEATLELLEALGKVLAEFDRANNDSNYTINLARNVEAPLRAAIARAKGQA